MSFYKHLFLGLLFLAQISPAFAREGWIAMKPPRTLPVAQGWTQKWIALSGRNHLSQAGFHQVRFFSEAFPSLGTTGKTVGLFVVGTSRDWGHWTPEQLRTWVENAQFAVLPEGYREGFEGVSGGIGKKIYFVPELPEFQAVFYPRLFHELKRSANGLMDRAVADSLSWSQKVISKRAEGSRTLTGADPLERVPFQKDLPKWWAGAMTSWLAPPLSLTEASQPEPQMSRTVAFPSWEYLTDVFPSDVRDLPGRIGEKPDQVWLEGEGVRYLLGSLVETGSSGVVDLFLRELLGLRLRQIGDRLESWIFLHAATEALLKSQDDAANGELWAVRLPETAQFGIQILEDGQIRVDALSHDPGRSVELRIRLPFLPDGVYLRGAQVSMASGDASIEAGIFGNRLAVVAKVNLFAQRLKEIDYWASVERNLDVFPPLKWIFEKWFSKDDSEA